MKKINWKDVEEAKDFERIPAGGYVCRVVKVEDNPKQEYLRIWCDPVDGEYGSFGENTEQRTGQDFGYMRFIRSYKPSAYNFFKAWLSALEKSNPGKFSADNFDGNENKMVNLRVGIVWRYEEYLNSNNEKRLRGAAYKLLTPDDIRAGKFSVPETKLLPPDAAPAPAQCVPPDSDIECPF